MPDEPSQDIIIQTVTASPNIVGVGGTFTVSVTVFAPDEDFEDQVGFRLFCFVCPCGGDGPANIAPAFFSGHVNETAPWTTPTATFTFTVTAGATPSIYNVEAALLEGTKGVPDSSVDFSVASGNQVLVVTP